MNEAAFPLLGAAFVVLFVLPALALLTKGLLVLVERDETGLLQGRGLRYLLLTGSSALPLAWFCSAGIHQVESGTSALSCLLEHEARALCLEPGFFALVLVVVAMGLSLPEFSVFRRVASVSSARARTLERRIARLVLERPALARLTARIDVTDDAEFTLGTRGLFAPRVLVSTAFAARLSDDMLAGALGHESEHVASLDPLRYLVLKLALAVNPFGRFLLEPHAARWRAAHEAHCDREAVLQGAAPLALADAIVRAARPSAQGAVALGACDTRVLRFRVEMLVAFTENMPCACRQRGPATFPMAFVLLAIALLLPHQTGTHALDALHTGSEHALSYVLP